MRQRNCMSLPDQNEMESQICQFTVFLLCILYRIVYFSHLFYRGVVLEDTF